MKHRVLGICGAALFGVFVVAGVLTWVVTHQDLTGAWSSSQYALAAWVLWTLAMFFLALAVASVPEPPRLWNRPARKRRRRELLKPVGDHVVVHRRQVLGEHRRLGLEVVEVRSLQGTDVEVPVPGPGVGGDTALDDDRVEFLAR